MIDADILEDILWHIHNWFDRDSSPVAVTDCEITGGELPESASVTSGAWYRIEGSLLNDGLHLAPSTDLSDETFSGTITVLRIPRPLLRLAEEITDWQATYGSASNSPYASESFGGYSYSIKSGSTAQNGSGGLTGWREVFRDRLNAWRKIS